MEQIAFESVQSVIGITSFCFMFRGDVPVIVINLSFFFSFLLVIIIIFSLLYSNKKKRSLACIYEVLIMILDDNAYIKCDSISK